MIYLLFSHKISAELYTLCIFYLSFSYFFSFLFFLHTVNVDERPTSKPFGSLHVCLFVPLHSTDFPLARVTQAILRGWG